MSEDVNVYETEMAQPVSLNDGDFTVELAGNKIRELSKLIQVISLIVEGPRDFLLTGNGLELHALDNPGSCFVSTVIAPTYFSSYDFRGDKIVIPLNISELLKVLNTSKDDDLLKILPSTNHVKFIFTKGREKREYKVLLHISTSTKEVEKFINQSQNIPLPNRIIFRQGKLKDTWTKLSMAKEDKQVEVTLDAEDKAHFVLVRAEEDPIKAQVVYSVGEEEDDALREIVRTDDTISSRYNMDYLEKVSQLDTGEYISTFEFDNGAPARITFKMDDILFSFLEAPLKLPEEDDEE